MVAEHFIGQLEVNVKPEKVDVLDKKILYLLSINARFSNTTIAKHLKLSREVVAYRLKRLQESDVLHGFLTLVNTQKVGISSKTIGIKVNSLDKADELINDLQTIPSITSIFQSGGMFDILISIMGKDLHTCYNTFQNFVLKHGDKVKHYQILTKLEQRFLNLKMLVEDEKEREYLDKVKEKKGSAFQSEFALQKYDVKNVKIDDTDAAILEELKLNARIPLTDLSKKTGIGLFQLQSRIKRLIKEDVINGFIPYISLAHLGLQFNFVFVNVKQGAELSFKTWVKEHPHIVWCSKYLGHHNYKLSLFVKNNAHLSEILKELCNEFGDKVSHIESLPIFRNPQYISFVK